MAYLTAVQGRLGLYPRRLVMGLLDGQYASMTTGRSMDFDDLRSYVPGDDVKDIDWKSSARAGELLIKSYRAERRHTLAFVVPTGGSLASAATLTHSKIDVVLATIGVLAWVACHQGDYVTVVAPGQDGPSVARPSYRDTQIEHMLAGLDAGCRLEAPDPDLVELLDLTASGLRRRCIVVVVLDDWDPRPADIDALASLCARHEVLAIEVSDLDLTDPALAAVPTRDQASGQPVPGFVARDRKVREQAVAARQERARRRGHTLDRLGIIHESVADVDDSIAAIVRLLERMRHASRH